MMRLHAVRRQATLEGIEEGTVRERLKRQVFRSFSHPVDWLCCGPHATHPHDSVMTSLLNVAFSIKHRSTVRNDISPQLLEKVAHEVCKFRDYSSVHSLVYAVHKNLSDVSKSDIQACLDKLGQSRL